ncbi:MAG: ABC transporter ATP-binding protein [Proteobacteria bacterium]|jgi:branched-chain amino acid transport system ATP-binding protein|nr:ABC transporter ATP-binding protein [Pseudomonadota bacterium]
MLDVRGLAVDHGRLRALWDVSLEVGAGERVGLLGANGAGKSTTMGAIIGLYRCAEGTITFDGVPIANASTARTVARGVALVPEGRRLFPAMTVAENLLLGSYGAGRDAQGGAALDPVYALFPVLADKARQAAGELSGGQQQMVAIGRALMSRPRLLLLDEPFIGVAPRLVDEILDALARIADDGVTMLLVEQNVHRALEFVARAYVIENGRTVLEGNRAALLGDEGFSRKFLGLE